jgi:hypothetical protein
MVKRKKRRTTKDDNQPGGDIDVLVEPTVELGSGYTMAVRYNENERPLVDVKTYGQVDLARLRAEIQHAFPNAQIRHKGHLQTVTVAEKDVEKLVTSRRRSVKDYRPKI